MGLSDELKNNDIDLQKQPASIASENEGPVEVLSGIRYRDTEIIICFNVEESRDHIRDDFSALMSEGIEKTIKEKFIPWLKGDQFSDKEDALVYDGLHLTGIEYYYDRIVAEYSPTGKDDHFGQFAFIFDSCSAYTEDMLEAVEMEVYVKDGKIIKVRGYDV